MKKTGIYIIFGIFFGVVMVKSEAISWFRIQEMFYFQAFHMYGIMGSAVLTGWLLIRLLRSLGLKNIHGAALGITPKDPGITRYLAGGAIFGIGWGLTGACPGPLYVLVGSGMPVFLIVIGAAVLGTFTYGLLRDRLPH
jgi:hypothetical protein